MKANITLTPMAGERFYFRVHLCSHEDWSGIAISFEEAVKRARERYDTVSCECPAAKAWSAHCDSDANAIPK